MKPWEAAALLAIVWFALIIAVAIIHTEVLIRDITPERDAALSNSYGQIAVLGALMVGALGYAYQRRRHSR